MLVSYVNGCVFHSAEEQKEGEEEKDREGEGEQTPAEPPAEDGAAQTVTVQATIEGVCVWWGGGGWSVWVGGGVCFKEWSLGTVHDNLLHNYVLVHVHICVYAE